MLFFQLVRIRPIVPGMIWCLAFACSTAVGTAQDGGAGSSFAARMGNLPLPAWTGGGPQASADRPAVEAPAATPQLLPSPPAEEVGLTELEALAMNCNPSLLRTAALVSAARGRAYQNGLPPNPAVGFDGQQLGSNGRAEQYGVAIGQEFVRREKLQWARAAGNHEAHRLQFEYAAQQQRVLTDIRGAFYRGLRAQEQLKLTRELVGINRQAFEAAEALFKSLEAGKTDMLQAEVEVENARIQAELAENRWRAVWSEIDALTGGFAGGPRPLAGELTLDAVDVPFDLVLQELRNSSPEIAAAREAIRRARCQLERERVEPLPNVTVEGLINWRDNGVDGDSNAGLAVSIPLPVWNRNQGGIQEARMELVAAERELQQLQRQLQQRLAPVYERYLNSRMQTRRYAESILPKAAEALNLARDAYRSGETNIVQLLTAQKDYAQFRLAALDAAESLRLAEAELEGLLLSGSLAATPR